MIKLNRFQWITHTLCWFPLIILIFDGVTNQLTANPIQAITQRTGQAALVLFLFSLVITPLNTYFGFKQPLRVRRALGLYSFFYALLHQLTFILLDYGANLSLIWLDIRSKPYILVGAGAFLILLALAITSFRWWKVRLGKQWKMLHRLTYLAGLLVIIHYWWVVKADYRLPLVYGILLAILFTLRLPFVKRNLTPYTLRFIHTIKGGRANISQTPDH